MSNKKPVSNDEINAAIKTFIDGGGVIEKLEDPGFKKQVKSEPYHSDRDKDLLESELSVWPSSY